MSRYGRYGGGKRPGPGKGRCCGCSEYCEAVGLARRLGDGYSACVMAASAHTIRSLRPRGRGIEGSRGVAGAGLWWVLYSFLGDFVSHHSPRQAHDHCFPVALLRAARLPPHPPALGCHFAHIDDHGGAFPWRFPATLADRSGRSRRIRVNLRLNKSVAASSCAFSSDNRSN